MAKKIFKTDMSATGFREIAQQIEQYKNSLPYKARLLAEQLANLGVQIARVEVATLDAIFTGELLESIHSEYIGSLPTGAVFVIKADSKHAVFVEFGTGQRGLENPNNNIPAGITWEYGKGEKVRQKADGTYYWFYFKDNEWHYTEGMPSRPFMYNTSTELYTKVEKVAKQIFK